MQATRLQKISTDEVLSLFPTVFLYHFYFTARHLSGANLYADFMSTSIMPGLTYRLIDAMTV